MVNILKLCLGFCSYRYIEWIDIIVSVYIVHHSIVCSKDIVKIVCI